MTEAQADDPGEESDSGTPDETPESNPDETPQPNRDQSLEDDESVSVIEQRPVLAVAIIFVVGAVAYAGISLLVQGTVSPTETGLFAVVFSVVYVVFAYVTKGR